MGRNEEKRGAIKHQIFALKCKYTYSGTVLSLKIKIYLVASFIIYCYIMSHYK